MFVVVIMGGCADDADSSGHSAFSNLDAQLFRKCINNVPFNKDKATETLAMIRKFMGLSSGSVYYIDPTPELELTPFNINKTLDTVEEKIKSGKYSNNWSFDYDLVQMFQWFRDGHTDYEVCDAYWAAWMTTVAYIAGRRSVLTDIFTPTTIPLPR